MEFKLVVGNVSSYLSTDPGVVTYLEGPLHTQQPPHWAIRSAAAIALLFKVSIFFFLKIYGPCIYEYSITNFNILKRVRTKTTSNW